MTPLQCLVRFPAMLLCVHAHALSDSGICYTAVCTCEESKVECIHDNLHQDVLVVPGNIDWFAGACMCDNTRA